MLTREVNCLMLHRITYTSGSHQSDPKSENGFENGKLGNYSFTQPQLHPEPSLTMAILKPIPSCPSRLSLGIRQSSNIRLAVEEARIPSLSSFFPSDSPAVGMGTRNALMPCNKTQTLRNGANFPLTWLAPGLLQTFFIEAICLGNQEKGGDHLDRTKPAHISPPLLNACMALESPKGLVQVLLLHNSFIPAPFSCPFFLTDPLNAPCVSGIYP